jgi:N6-adenosine-specific RNA methylase IME4
VLGAMDDHAFEQKVLEARDSAGRVFRRAVREAEIIQEREVLRARTAVGGSVADLHALIASGFRAGAMLIDPPWRFKTYGGEHCSRAVTEHYDTMALDEIKALPIRQLAAEDCAFFIWVTWPFMPIWHEVLKAWAVTYHGLGLDWIKTNTDGESLHWGNGYATRQNPEPCILAKVGAPLRLAADVHSVIMAPVGEHSEKPEEAARRIERLYGGPYLELFARRPRDGWTTWGNELPAPAPAPAPPSAPAEADTTAELTVTWDVDLDAETDARLDEYCGSVGGDRGTVARRIIMDAVTNWERQDTAPAAPAPAADVEDGIPSFLDRRSAS